MINEAGFRLGVGMVICNAHSKLFWGQRIEALSTWQFPQGGLEPGEALEAGLYRELYEEVGLKASDVKIIAQTQNWLQYRYPTPRTYSGCKRLSVGQKQKWFLLQLISKDSEISLNCTQTPEFKQWQWVDYWHPVQNVVAFKREVYQLVLREFQNFSLKK